MKPEFLRARTLLIEDHPPTAATLQTILQSLGFSKITLATNMTAAVDALKASAFDLILCDFQLGIVNGLMLVRMIRQSDGLANPNVPIVMITAHADSERVTEALNAGVDDVLVKPVQPDVIVRCLGNLLERSRNFVKAKDYAGPDRRRRVIDDHPGRRTEDNEPPSLLPKNKWIVPPKS
jgi:two-component system chemotaxis response regulator CheY